MKYKIVYTPLFQQDVNEVLDHITRKLKNPIAAHNFLDRLEAEILSISEHPTGFAPYPSTKDRPLPYYPLRVRNFTRSLSGSRILRTTNADARVA